ncbi:MAG: hypothetical protein UY92_C0001G0016 [Candidatus Magasanikbacteria bacterium GW2011_GWA2_56_11]|uniref:Uncharacterized protein n=1 Tax=Candidatus Magasanikbacteria bacterium GW2011_GWA2_56_11 TaxID=1619044 RepID=A0A0G2ANS7_9BACT|nr:MAG: hypothetical protein UY92_C0001G0016 [Candidatus Magasanikbacteria bacterium GW2011_GWA2_56_11]
MSTDIYPTYRPPEPAVKIEGSYSLGQFLTEISPEGRNISADQEEGLLGDLRKREAAVANKELLEALEEYGIDPHLIEVRPDGRIRIEVRNHFSKKHLPDGYAYKGGAARALLLRSLGSVLQVEPRDIDVVRLAPEEPYKGADTELAKEFMPDDFSEGWGVEIINSEDQYFSTRDVTVNEVLATDHEVIATEQCVIDAVRHIIRLTEFERGSDKDIYTTPGPKMLAKILRLYSESIHYFGEAEIANVEGWEFEQAFISPFWLALQLDHAFERSREIAALYVEELKKHGQVPPHIAGPEEAAIYLSNLIRGEFYYRHAPVEQFELEDEWMEN